LNEISRVAAEAFRKTHSGRSVDDVIIDDEVNETFLRECASILSDVEPLDFNWALMNLRKTGQLSGVTTRRIQLDHTDYLHAAEIAARLVEDQFEITIDRIFCSPENRQAFDEIAISIAKEISTYRLRKAALGLRKKRRLRPELIKRITDWDRRISSHRATELYANKTLIPTNPGVYIFRDTSGYLYVGEAVSLRPRVWKHLDHSDRKTLCRYLFDRGINDLSVDLHEFDANSNGRLASHRRAYESNLIASRNPRFNQRP
jgi:predicted GIY-YIG superfamily endonuclease